MSRREKGPPSCDALGAGGEGGEPGVGEHQAGINSSCHRAGASSSWSSSSSLLCQHPGTAKVPRLQGQYVAGCTHGSPAALPPRTHRPAYIGSPALWATEEPHSELPLWTQATDPGRVNQPTAGRFQSWLQTHQGCEKAKRNKKQELINCESK